jgi:AraC-like DNA-binding protein
VHFGTSENESCTEKSWYFGGVELSVEDFILLLILGSGVVACLIAAVAIVLRKVGNSQANFLLGLLLVFTALSVFNTFMALAGILNQFQHLYFIPIIYTFAIGPLFYLFTRIKTQPSYRLRWFDLVHFVPAILQASFFWSVGWRSAEYKSMIWQNLYGPYLQFIDEIGFILITIAYFYASYRLLKQTPNRLWIRPVFTWLKRFIFYTLILVAVIAVYTAAEYIAWLGFEVNIYNTAYVDIPLILAHGSIALWIGINAWVYSHQSLILSKEQISSPEGTSLHQELFRVLDEEKAYLNPDFSLSILSNLTKTSKNKLSAHFSANGSSFNETINRYRIEEFLKLVQQHPEYSIESLALDAGFGSKSTFNRAFAKEKGKSPQEYLRSQAKE